MPWQSETPSRAGTDTSALFAGGATPPPDYLLRIWPNRSAGFSDLRTALVIVAAGLSLPLLALSGNRIGWALLPFMIGAVIALYVAFVVNLRRSARLKDILLLWRDRVMVEHTDQKGNVSVWEANPYWVRPELHDNARIESYLTLNGNGRRIELGAFLSPEERVSLHDEVSRILRGSPAPSEP